MIGRLPRSLAQVVSTLSSDRELWVDEVRGTVLVSDWRAWARRQSAQSEQIVGRAVALRAGSGPAGAASILLLDGLCSRLLVCGPDVPAMDVEDLVAKSECDALIGVEDGDEFVGALKLDWTSRRSAPSVDACTVWLIPTSGTTSSPKLIPHTLETLARSTRVSDPKAGCRWGILYGVSRFAGIQVLLQAVLGGGVLLFPADVRDLGRTIEFFVANRCDALSATPTMWRKILMIPCSGGLRLRHATLGGEIADQKILDGVAARFPNARVRHVYASTEAGVGFSVRDGRAGFPAAWLQQEGAVPQMRIAGGTLRLRIPGRLSHPFGVRDVVPVDEEGYIDTGDAVVIDGDRVRFLGRASGVVNVGGNKVHPEEVEQVILAFPGVLSALVRARPNPFTGFVVETEVVVDGESVPQEFVPRLLEHCRAHLPPYKVPARVTPVPGLATSPAGKAERR